MALGDRERVDIPGIVLEDELGRGASSVVYRARRHGVPCAVKIGRADERTARWFRREAAALARVSHPGLPSVLEVGQHRDLPYLVMELVEGETLAERLSRGPMPEAEAIEIARELASTLDAVHRRGLVHRDVKPRNIVIEPGGRVRLVDFGFATLAHVAREAAGTRAYAAPEQLRVPAVVDGRADLYALGRVLYECVTGARWPESAEAPDRDLSPPLSAVVAGLIAPEPDARYRSASAVFDDLTRVAQGEAPHGPASGTDDSEPLPFVAREAELRLLMHAFEEACGGWGSMLLVRGPRGSGKSRLLRELGRAAAAQVPRALVLEVDCQSDDPTPLAGLRATLKRLSEAVAPSATDELLRAIGEDLAPLASMLWPPLAARLGVSSSAPRVGADAFTELAAELLARVASVMGPMLICIDDVQWLDPISADVFARLTHRMRRLPLLVVAAGRSDDDTVVFFGTAEDLHGISLPSLEENGASALVSAYLGAPADPALVAWVLRVSDGTPLGISELLDAMLDSGVLVPRDGCWRFERDLADGIQLPRGALALLERRIHELPIATRRVFTAAAVVGRAFSERLLGATVGLRDDEVGFAIAEARRGGLVEPAGDGMHRFVHDCVREALLAGIEPDERRLLHRRVAEAMDAQGAGDTYALATHYASGEPERNIARVLEVCHSAAHEALEAFDHEAALRLFEMARAAAARAGVEVTRELLVDAAEARLRLGDHEEALQLFAAALERTTGALERATVLGRMAWAHQMRPDAEAACEVLARAFEELGESMPVENAASAVSTAAAWVGARLLRDGPPVPSDPRVTELLCELHYQNLRLGMENGRPFRLLQSTVRAQALAAALGPSPALARTEGLYGLVATILGSASKGSDRLDRARRIAEQIGNPAVEAYCEQLSALAACFAGDFDTALERMRHLLYEHGHWLEAYELCLNVFNAYWIEAVRGRPREAWGWLEYAIARVARSSRAPAGFTPIAHAARATYAALHADADDAEIARAIRVPFDPHAPVSGVNRTGTWGSRARWFVERGDLGAQFEALIEEHRRDGIEARRAHPTVAEYYVAVAHGRIHQCLRARPHERGRAVERLAEAIADLEAVARSDLLRSHLRFAEGVQAWLRGAKRKARAKLDEAEQLALDQRCAWVRYGVERVRAHVLRAEGRTAASEERARAALHVAHDHGCVHWARFIEEELGVRLKAQPPVVNLSTSSRSGSVSTSRGQLKTLLHVLRTGSLQRPLEDQAQALVDEVLDGVDGDRGFLLFEPERRGAQVLTAGRERGSGEWRIVSPRARALIDLAQKTGAIQSPEEERSLHAVAVPLWLDERTAGVVYVERDPDRPSFASSELEILVALSYQIPVALELTRALRDRERLEEALRHAQKMEAVGRLAGGLTHDFNNILMVMDGSLHLLEERTDLDEELRTEIGILQEVVKRGIGLTRQLLTFARRQARSREHHDLEQVFGELGPMLRRLIPERITIRVEPAGQPLPTLIDRGLLEQAIVNIAVNARDAIEDRGTIEIRLSRVEVDEHLARLRPRLVPGPYACIVFSDDGAGMSREVRESAFEPFFTTKGRGIGTGLGLAMVHGFVEQSDGAIELESELGRGTTFRIYLPIAQPPAAPSDEDAEPRSEDRAEQSTSPKRETILVVDDEPYIRQIIERVLSQRGYHVLGTGAPEEALELARSSRIDLLISDVLMPEMSGPELARAIREGSPDTKLLFISGYTDGQLPDLIDRERVPLLHKPFGSDEIGNLVRELLAR